MSGIQLDGQIRFYDDRIREADQFRLARQAGYRPAAEVLWSRLSSAVKSGYESIACSFAPQRQAAYCTVRV